MNVLLIGSGGREHALARSLAASPLCSALLIAPGNPGTAVCGTNLPVDPADHSAVVAACRAHAIDLVVVGPEAPLVAGLVDDLAAAGIRAFGPSRAAARLEGSKAFTKEFARRHGIPTADFARFTDRDAARAHIRQRGAPIVVKADGLAAGKGVVVAATAEEAMGAADSMLSSPGSEIVVEECLFGEEASLFAVCDGQHAVLLGTAQDHKRVGDGDVGPNTGGMGAFSPALVLTPQLEAEVMDRIVRPTVHGMREDGAPFTGILYAGLMLTAQGPKLIEYNVRFGDPEAQALLPRLRTDLLAVLVAATDGTLDEVEVSASDLVGLTVVIATKGYPGPVRAGSPIGGLERLAEQDDVIAFQAGTALREGRLVANGGRVLGITALALTLGEARERAYQAVRLIDWPDGFCRSDIGARAAASAAGP